MVMDLSELYGMDIYTEDARYLGKVNDVIINIETGKIVRLTTEPLKAVSKDTAKKILKEKSVLYKYVKSVGDIILIGKTPREKITTEEVEEATQPLSNRYSARHTSYLGRR
jgi:sporulation protein YlmC with PRC-barrel domain